MLAAAGCRFPRQSVISIHCEVILQITKRASAVQEYMSGRWRIISQLHGRNQGLDLLRSIAIGLVLAAHSLALLPSGTWEHLPLAKAGFFGVELFFVLSGFLIGGILIREAEKSPLTPSRIIGFWRRRWIRTLPNYFLFLFLAFCVELFLHHASPPSWKYLFFLQNLAWKPPPHMPESWSLAVEEWFYLLCPIFLGALISISGRIRTWHFAAILLFLSLPRFLFLFANWNTAFDWDGELKKIVLFRLDAIFYGVLASWLYLKKQSFWTKYSIPAFAAGCVLVLFCTLIVRIDYSATLPASSKLLRGVLLFSLVSAGYALMIPLVLSYRSPWKPLSFATTIFSKISYSLYLSHLSLALPITIKLAGKIGLAYSIPVFLLLSTGISIATFLFFEHPITSLRDRWKN